MGIHDRDYYRPNSRWPDALTQLASNGFVRPMMMVLVVFFVGQALTYPNNFLGRWLVLDPDLVYPGGQVWRLGSYWLVHDLRDLLGFVVNCFVLWFFGKMVEEEVGPGTVAWLFFTSVLVAGLVYSLLVWTDLRKDHPGFMGSAGAITTLLVLAAWRNPFLEIRLFFMIPMHLWVAVAFFVLLEFLLVLMEPKAVPESHLIGAAVATLYELSGRWGWDPLASFRQWRRARTGPKLRVFRDDPPKRKREKAPSQRSIAEYPTAKAPTLGSSPMNEEEMDRILEKISRSGMHSLSEEERKFLLRASDRLKKQKKE